MGGDVMHRRPKTHCDPLGIDTQVRRNFDETGD